MADTEMKRDNAEGERTSSKAQAVEAEIKIEQLATTPEWQEYKQLHPSALP